MMHRPLGFDPVISGDKLPAYIVIYVVRKLAYRRAFRVPIRANLRNENINFKFLDKITWLWYDADITKEVHNMKIREDGMVALQSIYDEVIKYYGWEQYSESKRRLLRKKYAFLQRRLVLCSPSEFKDKGDNVVPWVDAPIIRDLLIEAVNDQIGRAHV